MKTRDTTSNNNMNSDELVRTAQEVDRVCKSFLYPRGFSYFQFKRIYRNGSFIILANRPDFFQDLLEKDLVDPSLSTPLFLRQSCVYFWDESLPVDRLFFTRENKGVYHGLTIPLADEETC